jgi:hypothetical protein
MKNAYFSQAASWRIVRSAISDSLEEIRNDGQKGDEGIVLWLGRDEGDVVEVSHLVRLRGPGVEKRPDLIHIHSSLMNEVADLAIEREVRLVGQVHSHGPFYALDLSERDIEYGVHAPQYLSLVAPDYGDTASPIHSWGVHIFLEGYGYSRLSRAETEQRLNIVDGQNLPFLTAGGQ